MARNPAYVPDADVERIAHRLERQLRMSLDRCEEILSMPLSECLNHSQAAILVNAQIQTTRAIIHACVKLGIEAEKMRVRDAGDARDAALRDARLGGNAACSECGKYPCECDSGVE